MRSPVIPVLLALSLGGCGTIVRGTTEPVAFNSEPSGASVTTSAGFGCAATPCTITIPRKTEFTATFALSGYRSEQVAVTTQVSGGGAAGVAGNVLAGGLIGIGVDAASGASLDHVPNPVFARLVPLSPSQGRATRRRGAPTS